MSRALLGLCLALVAGVPASAQDDVAAFYKGKTIRLVVGIGVGSGYDINARLLARYMAAHIPGQPTIIVQNQPGAGSLTMTNALYNNGPFDGTIIGASFNGMPTTPLLQPSGARFDPVKLNWLGSTNRETQITYVWHAAPVDTFDDIKRTEIVVGSQAPGSTQYDFPMLANAHPRHALQGDQRLREHAEDSPRDGARRSAGQRRHELFDAQGAQRPLDHGQEGEDSGAVGAQEASRTARRPAHPRHGEVRERPRRVDARHHAAGIRPPVLPAAERAGRAARGAAPRVRRHHEGPGLSGRGRQAQDRGRAALRRAGRRPGRAGLPHTGRDRRPRAHRDGTPQ